MLQRDRLCAGMICNLSQTLYDKFSHAKFIFFQVNGRNIDGATPLCDACSSGHADVVQLLLENGAIVNPPLLLTSPLHEAALRGKCCC